MSFVNYSPWQDAAQYGAGLGNTLGQVLLSIPMQKAHFELQKMHYEQERNRDRLSEQMQQAHAKYYDALTAAMPTKEQALKDREEERTLHNIQVEDYLKAKAENLKADTASKVKMRDANIANKAAQLPYIGPLAQTLMALRGAMGQAAQMRATMAPENAATGRLTANANAALAGTPGLPNIDPSQIQLPPIQLPQTDPMAHAVQAGLGAALPPPPMSPSQSPTRMSGGRPMNPAGLSQGIPSLAVPSPMNELGPSTAIPRIRVQSKSTGRTGWATPQEVATDPDLQQIQ